MKYYWILYQNNGYKQDCIDIHPFVFMNKVKYGLLLSWKTISVDEYNLFKGHVEQPAADYTMD